MAFEPGSFSIFAWLQGLFPEVKLMIRLTIGAMDPDVQHELNEFVEASFPGYAAVEFLRREPAVVAGPLGGNARNEMAIFRHSRENDAANIVAGYHLVAVDADGGESIVCFENFRGPVVIDDESNPIGLVIYLGAVLLTI